MTPELDVYREWLGIKETARPLNYYQILRLNAFEDRAELVRTHYRKMNAHVRKFAAGEYAQRSQELLDELAKAMLCLTDVRRKREYDASLGRKIEAEGRRLTLEEILLANKVLDQQQLDKARRFADAVGLDLHQAVIQQKLAEPEVVMMSYAESMGLPYIDLGDIGVDVQLAPLVPPTLARQHSCVPVMADDNQLLMASPTPLVPDVEEELRLRTEMPVRTVLCTPAAINEAIAKFYPRDAPEMVPVATRKKAKAAKPGKTRDEQPAPPRSAQETAKRRTMFSVIAFNITVVAVMLGRTFVFSDLGIVTAIAAAILAGLVAGGVTFGAMWASE